MTNIHTTVETSNNSISAVADILENYGFSTSSNVIDVPSTLQGLARNSQTLNVTHPLPKPETPAVFKPDPSTSTPSNNSGNMKNSHDGQCTFKNVPGYPGILACTKGCGNLANLNAGEIKESNNDDSTLAQLNDAANFIASYAITPEKPFPPSAGFRGFSRGRINRMFKKAMRQRGKIIGNRNQHHANDQQHYVQNVHTTQMGHVQNLQTSQMGYAYVPPNQYQNYTYPGSSGQQMDMGQVNAFFQLPQPPVNNPSTTNQQQNQQHH